MPDQHIDATPTSQRQNSIRELKALSARIQRSRERAMRKRPHRFFSITMDKVRVRPWTKAMLRVREIGQALYAAGGRDHMRKAYDAAGQPAGISACWDGIGGWYS